MASCFVICNGAAPGAGLNNTCRIGTTAAGNFNSAYGSILGGYQATHTLCSEMGTIVMGCKNSILSEAQFVTFTVLSLTELII